MESGGYGSAHLSSPALVVFSQAAASGLSEAFRLQQQRPFHNSQVQVRDHHQRYQKNNLSEDNIHPSPSRSPFKMPDPKDLHHLSLVGSYGAHLLHGFPPHFLHSSLSSNLAGNGANPSFGSNGAFVKPFPSAFAPPKCISALSSMEQVGQREDKGSHQWNRSLKLPSAECHVWRGIWTRIWWRRRRQRVLSHIRIVESCVSLHVSTG